MAALVIAAAGAGAGYATAGTVFGAQVGWALGSMLGSMLTGPKKIQGAATPLIDLKVVGADYGQPIPYVRGSCAIPGQMWWNTDRRATTTTTTESSGGKGGGGAEVTTSTTTYDMDCLIGLTDNEIVGIARIWDQGKLIYTADASASAESLTASAETEHWTRMTVYTGSATQLPDPTYEAAVGTANACAYRGRSYVFIEGLKLGQSGQVRNLTFEVVADGTLTSPLSATSTWTSYASANDSTAWWNAAYGNGVFVATSYPTTGSVGMRSTDNGETWSATGGMGLPYIGGIAYGGDRFVAVGFSGITSYAEYSTDGGATWTGSTTGAMANLQLYSVAYGDGVWIAVSANSWGGTKQVMRSTDDGANWTNITTGTNRYWTGVAYGNSTWVLVGTSVVAYSTDAGLTWTQGSSTAAMTAVTFGNGYFVAVSTTPTKYALYSSNGISWTESASATQRGDGIAYGNGLFVKVSANASSVYDKTEYSDDNGATWTTINVPSQLLSWHGIAFGNDYFVAVANTGSGQRTMRISAPLISLSTIVPPAVSDVVSALCVRAGLTAGQIDVTGLSSITRTVRCLPITQVAPTRQALELLMASYFFEMTLSDKLYFRPRGGSSIASIPYIDLGASATDEPSEPLALRENNDIEIPAQLMLSYINVSDDYQTGTEPSDRLISATAGTVGAVQMSLGLTPAEAKAVVDTMLLDQYASRWSAPIALLGNYARLEPTDVVTVTAADNSTFRMRLVKKTDSYPLLQFHAVLDDASVLTSQGITSTDYTPSTVVSPAVNTEMELLDIPILQDADNDPGFYVATKGDGTPYPGSALFYSTDGGTEYTRKATVLESAVFGTCTTTLGNWTGARVVDNINTVTVNVGDGTLASSTRTAVLNSLSVNAMLIGSELIQFITATLVSTGVYTLSGLLRGGRGTEWAMVSHAASERCVLLRAAGLRRAVLTTGEVGLSLYYKGVTLGRAVSTATAEAFTNTAIGLKPFSPFALRAARDGSNNITFTWQRRTRLAVRTIGSAGISVPLGEESAAYEIDIYASGAYATVLRTITATSETASYTAAEQTADGLTPGNTVYAKVYQLSAAIGRGYALQQAA